MNILVVDDEKEIADVIELYLQNDQYSVMKFYTGEDALKCIKNTRIDLAILDIMLLKWLRLAKLLQLCCVSLKRSAFRQKLFAENRSNIGIYWQGNVSRFLALNMKTQRSY